MLSWRSSQIYAYLNFKVNINWNKTLKSLFFLPHPITFQVEACYSIKCAEGNLKIILNVLPRAIHDYVTKNEVVANVASHIGVKDLILSAVSGRWAQS